MRKKKKKKKNPPQARRETRENEGGDYAQAGRHPLALCSIPDDICARRLFERKKPRKEREKKKLRKKEKKEWGAESLPFTQFASALSNATPSTTRAGKKRGGW